MKLTNHSGQTVLSNLGNFPFLGVADKFCDCMDP